MDYFAHSGGFNTGEHESFGHFVSDNGFKIFGITVLFIAITLLCACLLQHTSNKVHKAKKEAKEDE